MYRIFKITSNPTVDFAAEELKKYLRMMMPRCGEIDIAYRPDATDGFLTGLSDRAVTVDCPEALLAAVPHNKRDAVLAVLAHDPRPTYQNDPTRVYGMTYDNLDIRFTVEDGVLHVKEILS